MLTLRSGAVSLSGGCGHCDADKSEGFYNMITKPLRRGSAPPPSGLRADTPPK